MIKIPFLLSFEHGNSRVGFLKFPLSFLPVNIYLPLTIVKSGVKEFFGTCYLQIHMSQKIPFPTKRIKSDHKYKIRLKIYLPQDFMV